MIRRLACLWLLFLSAQAQASVDAGVGKWRAGDWEGAVAEWVTPAARGDADALFNMGQAYRLGRGVPLNRITAIDYYRRAADKGHAAAAANLGITLWQALVMDIAIVAFYLVYTFFFNIAYDRIFPLPGAQPATA